MISVIIPTYQRNDLLARCLNELVPGRQTLDGGEYEVIITDDGRRATAEAMIRERYPWARWTKGPGRGPAANRNHGMRQARGEWIAFTDDDCVPCAGWLKAFADARQPGVEIYEGKTTCEAGLLRFAVDAPINLAGGALYSCNLMIAKHLYEQVGGLDEAFPHADMEDTDFRDRLLRAGHRYRFVPEAVVDHPPRPRVRGTQAGMRWESRVYFCKKWGEQHAFWRWMPVFVAKVRLAEIVKRYPLRDYPAACASLVAELIHVVTHARRWERQYVNVPLIRADNAKAETER